MPELEIDFEGNNNSQNANPSQNDNQQDPAHLDGQHDDNHNVQNKDNSQDVNNANNPNNSLTNNNGDNGDNSNTGFKPADNQNNNKNDNISSTGGLAAGTNLEIDDKTYTVDDKGNIVDDKGNIFKEAKDVDEWLKSVNVEDDNNKNDNDNKSAITVQSLQDALGTEITDKDGKPVQYTDDAAGAKAYVDDVIALKSQELQQAAVNKLFADNPVLKQFSDYITLNNGDPRGFGQIPDRSGISVEKDNENQQIAIIKVAAQEFGNKSVNDNYINYLKQTGGLYDEARAQLANLQAKDKETQQRLAQAAEEKRKQEDAAVDAYWNNVNDVINSRVVGGYKLPESFVKEVNGTKLTLTPSDFYDYLSRPIQDKDGNVATQYQRDLAALDPKVALQKEMLSAWLLFTGSTPEDLGKLLINEDNVRVLKIKSKQQRTSRTVRINTKPKKADVNDIILS